MYSFQLPVKRASREGFAEGILLFSHLERHKNIDLKVGNASLRIQEHLLGEGEDFVPIIPILNSESDFNDDINTSRIYSFMWSAFITGGRMAGSAHPEGPSHYSIILRSLWKEPNFLGCYIENFALSGEVDRDILEKMQLCLGRVSVESGVLTVESSGPAIVPRELLRV